VVVDDGAVVVVLVGAARWVAVVVDDGRGLVAAGPDVLVGATVVTVVSGAPVAAVAELSTGAATVSREPVTTFWSPPPLRAANVTPTTASVARTATTAPVKRRRRVTFRNVSMPSSRSGTTC
jgi:hypothetical protein